MTHPTLSLRQKIGQLFMVTIEGRQINGEIINLLTEYQPGGVQLTSYNLNHPKQIYQLTKELQHFSNKALQLFIAVKPENIMAKNMTTIPTAQTLGTIDNRLYTKRAADFMGKELKATGMNMLLGPDLSLSNEKSESFSGHIRHVEHHGRAMIEGYHKHGIISAASEFSDDFKDTLIDQPLYKTAVQPYIYAIQYGLQAVVTNHTKWAAPFLRHDIGFTGLIMQSVPDDAEEKQVDTVMKSLEEGADVVSLTSHYQTQLYVMEAVYQAVKSGDFPLDIIDRAANRINTIKKKHHINKLPAFDRDAFQDKSAVQFMEKLALQYGVRK